MKIRKIVSTFMSLMIIASGINIVDVKAAQKTLYGDYVLISNTSFDYESAQSTGAIVFDTNGMKNRDVHVDNDLGDELDVYNHTENSLYDDNGGKKTITKLQGTTSYTVGQQKSFGTDFTYECIGVGDHCYIWIDTALDYTSDEKTQVCTDIKKEFDEIAYPQYLQPYNFEKYISYKDYSDRISIFITGVASGQPTNWCYRYNQNVTGVYRPVTYGTKNTTFTNCSAVLAHECQHAMADCADVIYGLWLNEALSVSIMPNHEEWLQMGSSSEACGKSFISGWQYHDNNYFDYQQPYQFIRYLNTQANNGVYKNRNANDNAAYTKFYDYFYSTAVPSEYTGVQKDIYVIEYLMSEYHNENPNIFANPDGSVWTFNDALKYFKLAQMKRDSSGIYSFGEDTEHIRKYITYSPVYTGESGKSVNIYGTGSIIVKTLDGKFEVPASHGDNIEYTAFNANIPFNDGLNTLERPTKTSYLSGETLDLDGMDIVFSKDGKTTHLYTWEDLEEYGGYVYILDMSDYENTFRRMDKISTLTLPRPSSSGTENFIMLFSEHKTDSSSFFAYNYMDFNVILEFTVKENTGQSTTATETTTETTTQTTTKATTETTTEATTSIPSGYDANGFGSDGSYQPAPFKNDVYEISNAGQLYWYAAKINGGSKADAKLTADITVNSGTMTAASTGVRKWTPIANATAHQSGTFYTNTFDGQNHYISGLYCDDQLFFAGLFGCLAGGTVKNTGVINSYFNANKGSGAISGGGSDLVTGGTINNCYSAYNTITATDNAGGIVGGAWKGTTITNCFCAYCTLTATNSSKVNAFTGPMAGYIATGESASTSGGKYIAANMNSGSTTLYGDVESKQYFIGDADLNGKTDILDAIAAQKTTFAYSNFASYTADMNKDRSITNADAAMILKNINSN